MANSWKDLAAIKGKQADRYRAALTECKREAAALAADLARRTNEAAANHRALFAAVEHILLIAETEDDGRRHCYICPLGEKPQCIKANMQPHYEVCREAILKHFEKLGLYEDKVLDKPNKL